MDADGEGTEGDCCAAPALALDRNEQTPSFVNSVFSSKVERLWSYFLSLTHTRIHT